MNRKLLSVVAFAIVLLGGCTQREELADYVNPFVGAICKDFSPTGEYLSPAKTFPGATTPFGMIQVTPHTISGDDVCCEYDFNHKTIEGFAMMQLGGVGWFGEFGDFVVMPTTGPLCTIPGREDGSLEGYRSTKADEQASAGYYGVTLADYGIRFEATATPRTGIMRITFPENGQSRIQVDLAKRSAGTAEREYIKVVNDHAIEGWMYCPTSCGGWGNGDGHVSYTVYYYAEFSKPFTDWGVWSADIPEYWGRRQQDVDSDRYNMRVKEAQVIRGVDEYEGRCIGFFTEFPSRAGEQVEVKVAMSFVDAEGARGNFKAEAEGKSFDKALKEARRMWNAELSKMSVEGGSLDDKCTYYTALYHSLIEPRIHEDADGRYTGGDGLIHTSDGFVKRTLFSGWDVFRSWAPLMTLIRPDVTNDLINSQITLAEESGRGYYNRWELANAYTECMIGNPLIPVLSDAYAKGIRGYDAEKAYEIAKKTSEVTGNGERNCTWGNLNISYTLEYGFADWAIGQMADLMGKPEEAAFYYDRGQAYRNTFDPSIGWFRPIDEEGNWWPWSEENWLQEYYGCIESNPYQQGWFVPHDTDGLADLLGGRENALKMLHGLLDPTPLDFKWNLQYNQANEVVHLIPFLYNVYGEPWNTQKWTRTVCRNAYNNTPRGICGNEDCGQMSAWYVLCAAGIHPSNPASTKFQITSPVFDRINIGKFTIVAEGNSPENIYIQSAELNGQPYNSCTIDYTDIMAGGTLKLVMGPVPNTAWGLD